MLSYATFSIADNSARVTEAMKLIWYLGAFKVSGASSATDPKLPPGCLFIWRPHETSFSYEHSHSRFINRMWRQQIPQ